MARRRSYGEYEREREREYEGRRGYGGGGYGGYGGYSFRRRRERRREERQVELASFGALIAVFMISLIVHLSAATIATIGGGILVGAAVFQWQRRWRVNPVTWIGGAIMLIGGIFGLQQHTDVPGGILFPMGIFALVIIASAVTGEF